ncbi:MAG: transporter [Acidimicrobiales bacterium]|nr:transporter [Acidimicrobiales bacterium]
MASPSQPSDEGDDHYFSAQPSAPSSPRSLRLALPDGISLALTTDAGVFSADAVDAGTRLLLAEGPAVRAGGTVLDLGCGYGPIACALAARGGPDTTVWAVDVNERALALCRANADAAGLAAGVHTATPDAVPDDVRFDQVWSNPPIRVGKRILHDMLTRWLGQLSADGEGLLVVHKHLGADSLARWLADAGWPTERFASRMGYRLLRVTRGPAHPLTAAPPDGAAT